VLRIALFAPWSNVLAVESPSIFLVMSRLYYVQELANTSLGAWCERVNAIGIVDSMGTGKPLKKKERTVQQYIGVSVDF